MKKKITIISIIAITLCALIAIGVFVVFKLKNNSTHYEDNSDDGTFSTSFIRNSHKYAKGNNYMISPYSVEIALSMLRDGTKGDTYEEIEKVAPKRTIKTLAVKGKVNVANALFVKNKFKKDVREEYTTNLKENYNAEFLYDEFKTPDVINKWADKETNGMIKKVVNQMDPYFVLGIANAVAMEEEWLDEFQCEMIMEDEFTKLNGKKYKVSMLTNNYTNNASYYKDDKSEAIVIPYKQYDRKTGKEVEEDGEQLEFIGILPNDIDEYISKLDLETIKEIDKKKRTASDELDIYLKLPKFDYEYDFKLFKDTLEDMGIKSVFDASSADLSNMLDNHPDSYVSDAVHKTYVKVDEKGTKAAAITYFGVKDNAMVADETEHITIEFNKPFIFIIKDTKTNEIAFFGVVYEPNKYKETKC